MATSNLQSRITFLENQADRYENLMRASENQTDAYEKQIETYANQVQTYAKQVQTYEHKEMLQNQGAHAGKRHLVNYEPAPYGL